MTDSQRAIIREALKPAIMKVFKEALLAPHQLDDEDASNAEALFDNLPLGVLGVANDIVEEYKANYRKGQASVSAHAK